MFSDPHVQDHGLEMRLAAPHGRRGAVGRQTRSGLSATPVTYRHAPPPLGWDTDAVLEEVLGLDSAARGRLREAGAIG